MEGWESLCAIFMECLAWRVGTDAPAEVDGVAVLMALAYESCAGTAEFVLELAAVLLSLICDCGRAGMALVMGD